MLPCRAMDGIWKSLDVKLFCYIMLIGIQRCRGLLNFDGSTLLESRDRVTFDPYGSSVNWNPDDIDPCNWFGALCVEGNVHMLNVNAISTHGTLAHEGSIPKILENFGILAKLNKIACANRKIGCSTWRSGLRQLVQSGPFGSPINELFQLLFRSLQLLGFRFSASPASESHPEFQVIETEASFLRRILIQNSMNRNLAAAPAPNGPPLDKQASGSPMMHSSGAFPAVTRKSKKQPSAPVPSPLPGADATSSPPTISAQLSSNQGSFELIWKYVLVATGAVLLFTVTAIMICMCQSKAVPTKRPRKTGISQQLQKAFVTGVPKLNRSELEIACEDFSNIIDNHNGCTVYKGILSSGVEISASAASAEEWSSRSEAYFWKKIETLSQVNHKNFINLLGYCDEDEPFTRMMVFEYAPNGTLWEHLHVEEFEHLDWSARMRILMGTAYCLQYMHDLKPAVAVTNFTSADVFLTDDYAAKICDTSFWVNFISKKPGDDEKDLPLLLPATDPAMNVYSFGLMLLEVISGRCLTSKDGGSIVSWASEYLKTRETINDMVDPTLKSFKNSELEIICDVIQVCLEQDPIKRATMTEVMAKLRQAIAITPNAAIPNMSPLWWAELEILSEAC